MSTAIIFGSSRSFGHTRKFIDEIFGPANIELFDLNQYNIGIFDYEHRNRDDDFVPLMEKLLAYDTWIIATPVYWYSMSTQHKIFFDRFSDLLTIRKDLGRQLRGKNLFVFASFQSSYPKGFEDIFDQLCEYLGITYLGSAFVYSGSEETTFLENNKIHIEKTKKTLNLSI